MPDTGMNTGADSGFAGSSAVSYDGLFVAVGVVVLFGLFVIHKAEQ